MTQKVSRKIAAFLPQVKLFEFITFIQIGIGNPNVGVNLIGLGPFWQAKVSTTLNLVGNIPDI